MEQLELDLRETINRLREENAELRSSLGEKECGRALIQQAEEFSRILVISKLVVTELELPKVLKLVADNAREMLGAEAVLVPMLNEQRDRYSYMECSGVSANDFQNISFPVNVGMCGWVLRHERSLIFGEDNPFWMDEKTVWEEGQQSAVLVPLFGRRKIIGGLSALGKKGGGSFSRHDLDLLTILANQISGAIENALLFKELNREIEERKRTEETLRESEQRFRVLVEQAPEAIAVYDAGLDLFVDVNTKAEQLFGCSRAELLKKSPSLFFPADQPDGLPVAQSVRQHLEKVLAGEVVVFQRMVRNIAEDRDVLCEARLALLPSATGQLVRCSYFDITERKQLEDQLLQAQKMEAVGLLAGGIAHDFNNILTAILGYASLLQVQLEEGSRQQRHVAHIITAGQRASELTKQILAFSRKQLLSPKRTELNQLIGGMQKLLRRLIGEDIMVQTHCCEGNLWVLVDPGQIEQVIMNLCTNARDAMPTGGLLSLVTSRVEFDEASAHRHDVEAPGHYACISLSDNGQGMDAKARTMIFEPFFTTKEVGKGTGLGLSIVYGIIKQHNGQITVYSEPGQGTTFKIYLPLLTTDAEDEAADVCAAPAVARQGDETILLAEDNAVVRDLIVQVLSEYGYTVIAAVDGDDAIAQFKQHRQDIDLLLFDVVMPKKSGKDACDIIRAMRPDIKVLFMSGYTADIISSKGIMEGGIHYISKPISPMDLCFKVREVLDRKEG